MVCLLLLIFVVVWYQVIENEEEVLVFDVFFLCNSFVLVQLINGKWCWFNVLCKSKGGNVLFFWCLFVVLVVLCFVQLVSNFCCQMLVVDQLFVDEEFYDFGVIVDIFIISLNGKKNKFVIVFISKVGKFDENDEKIQCCCQVKEVINGKIFEDVIMKKDVSGQWEYSNV